MTSRAVNDFLTKQLFIEKNIVTYRSLSRELAIHVNVAKNELAAYHTNPASQSQSAATYLLSGEVRRHQTDLDEENTMDVDVENDGDSDGDSAYDGEDIPQTTIMLVGEKDLERAKSQFTRLHTIHVYSLSPSPIRDASLICEPTQSVRNADQKNGPEMAVVVGKVVGAQVQMKAFPPTKAGKTALPVAGPSKGNPVVKTSSSSKVKTEVGGNNAEGDDAQEKARNKAVAEKPKEKPKATGKLDFSKAKKKEPKEQKAEQSQKEPEKKSPTSSIKSDMATERVEAKRGTKRKSISTLISDSEVSESSSANRSKPQSKLKPRPRVQKAVVYTDDEVDAPQKSRRKGRMTLASDEDDEVKVPQKSRRKGRMALTSDEDSGVDTNIQAMMDVDDDQVIRASRATPITEKEEQEGTEDEDVVMADEPVPKPKPKKRKQKKVIPLGRNGLKKKRVVKSRTALDSQGYMATEDYSSYESVDEEEPESAAPVKDKGKARVAKKPADGNDSASDAPQKTKSAAEASTEKSLPVKGGKKPSKRAVTSKQNSLTNFFGPGPKSRK